MPLLDWLERCALPEESRLAEDAYAEAVAGEFLAALAQAGTTTALVFGAHFASAMDIFFAAARRSGLRITAGQVVSDRILRPDLLTTPETALAEGRKLIERWHGDGRLRYAVTPRFSLSASEAMLDVCAELTRAEPDVWFTSHMNENTVEVARVVQLFAGAEHYLGSYYNHGLVTPRSVFAHNVHANDIELGLLASTGAWVAHCPTSNAALGSGLFPMRRHVENGARVAMGSDVGGGTGFSMFKEGLQAYFMQQLLGPEGLPLSPAHLLYLCTRAGAQALGLDEKVGDLRVGKEFDALWLHPADRAPWPSCCGTPPTHTTPWPRSSRWRHRLTSAASGSAATGFADLRRLPVCDATGAKGRAARDQRKSYRSRFMTLTQAATKSRTNLACASSQA